MKLHCRLNRLWGILPMCAFIAAFFIGCTISRSDSVPSPSSEPLPAATPAPIPRTLMEGIAPMPIACSYITYYAIQTDGTLIGWGENLRGLINYPDSLPSYEDAVVMMEDVAAVYAGDWVTLILCSAVTCDAYSSSQPAYTIQLPIPFSFLILADMLSLYLPPSTHTRLIPSTLLPGLLI